MICTIGSLVQETSNRLRWLFAVSLYTIACLSTSMLLGALLGMLGYLLRGGLGAASLHFALPHAGAWAIGLLALAYAASDMGWLPMPRPNLTQAVPISWWRSWQPYGAALVYGA